jgi:hypothetical protein
MRQAEDQEKPEDRRPWRLEVGTVEGRRTILVGHKLFFTQLYAACCVPRGFKAGDLCVVKTAQKIIDDNETKTSTTSQSRLRNSLINGAFHPFQ